VLFYLFAYLIASFAVFGVMAHVAGENDTDQELDHYSGLARDNPFLATVLAVALGSLAGIPPLAGFMGKLFIFIAAFKASLYGLLAIAIIGVVISIYYYFGWIKAAFFETGAPSGSVNPAPARTPVGVSARLALAALALCSIFSVFTRARSAPGCWHAEGGVESDVPSGLSRSRKTANEPDEDVGLHLNSLLRLSASGLQ